MNPTTHANGHKRDQRVLTHLEALKCLSQEQIHLLEFWNVSTEMSHRCTQRLEKDHLIRRVKMSWSDMPDWFYPYEDKKPDQILHRIGKAWLYTSLNIRTMPGNEEKMVYYKDEETEFLSSFKIKPDGYCKTVHEKRGIVHYFCEFQVLESSNNWNKPYPLLLKSFADNQSLTLMIVTTGDYGAIKKQLIKEMSGMRNVKLAFYTLDELRGLCWKIVLSARERYRQKELTQ